MLDNTVTKNCLATPIATPTILPQPQAWLIPPSDLQITPQNAKFKCKNFLVTLLKKTSSIVAPKIPNLVQDLVYGRIEPEIFTKSIPFFKNLSAHITMFLEGSLPYLRQSLKTGEMSINEFTLAKVKNSHQPAATTMVPGPRISMSNMQNSKSILININFPNIKEKRNVNVFL